jgi:hypothetical protein
VSIRINAIRLSGGSSHQHITQLWWTNPANGEAGESTRAAIVNWIEHDKGKVDVEDAFGHRIDVGVVHLQSGQPYLRTHADGAWTDNLLALPRR